MALQVPKYVAYGLMVAALVGAFFAGSAVTGWWRSSSPEEKAAREVQQQTRPSFILRDLQGKMRDVAEWDGKVLVVNFWATWCPPCKREMPGFMELQQRYAAQGVQFVGIALDEEAAVRDFVDTNLVEYPILLGGDAALAVSHLFGNRYDALPYTAFIGRDGKIISTMRGEVEMASAEKMIQKAISQ